MLAPGQRVLLACSGGGDSMALLHALIRLDFPVVVAHLDHASRPDSADFAAWVAAHAETLGLPCIMERRPVADEAAQLGCSFEMHARTARYEFLIAAAKAHACAAIATGHTASDQAETLVMRLLRGTGPAGLAGIPPVGAHGGFPVVRPLIELSREQLRAWLEKEGVSWREDETNASTAFLRNRVRHELLPLLRDEYNPAVEGALNRLAESFREDDRVLRALADEVRMQCVDSQGILHRDVFREQPVALQRRVLMGWFEERAIPPVHEHVLAAREFACHAKVGERLSLPNDVIIYAGRDTVQVAHPSSADTLLVRMPIPGSTEGMGLRFAARLCDEVPPRSALAAMCNARCQVFDAASLGDVVEIRSRRSGDRMHPLGAPGSRKLSDILIDAGVPEPQRDELPLLVNGDVLLWVVGGPVAASVAVTSATEHVVIVEITDAT